VHSQFRIVLGAISFLALTFALVLVPSAHVLAQVPQYPWDQRPSDCSVAARASDPDCKIDNWPSFVDTANRIAVLYLGEQFVLLDLAMADAVGSDKRFVDGNTPADAVYWAFRQMMRAPGTNPSHGDKISRWQTAMPGSAFATFAQARFAYGSAWNIRGNQYGSSVSKESWELFEIRLRETEQILLNAPQQLKDTPLWHRLLLAVTLDMSQPATSPQTLFANAVKRWPRQFGLYELILTRMTPKWGGGWQLVDESIREWSNQLSATEGQSLYARLYVSLINQENAEEMGFDWNRLKMAFDDLIARYPSPVFKNFYASFACLAEDKPAFRMALAKLPPKEIDPSGWLSGHSYEACIRWDGI
jgi:hypothetical protein